MTREEQILSEAKKHYYDSINCHNAFLHGVEWADEHPANVWHNASEEPTKGAHILMEYNFLHSKEFKSYKIGDKLVNNWDSIKKIYRISRWAYISDLLPKGGEK